MLAPVPRFDILPVEAKGLTGDGSTDNRALIQDQWDAAAAQGKYLSIPRGVYAITMLGSGANKYGLTPGNASLFYGLLLGPGVTLKISDNQVVDGDTAALIKVTNHSGGGYIGWPYGSPDKVAQGGKLIGNCDNQPGKTVASGEGGTRYQQAGGSIGVFGLDSVAGGGSQNWTIDNLEISDFFGNPVFWAATAAGSGYFAHTRNITSSRIYTIGCGEGILYSSLVYSPIKTCEIVGVANKQVGDYFEPAFCRWSDYEDLYAHTGDSEVVLTTGGAALDLYCSQQCTAKNIRARCVGAGVQLHGVTGGGNAGIHECDKLDIRGVTCDRVGSYAIHWGAYGDNVVRDVTVWGRNSAGQTSPSFGGVADSHSTFRLRLSDVYIRQGGGINCSGAGSYSLSDIEAVDGGATTQACLGAAVNTNPVLWISDFRATGYLYGYQFSGTSQPTGRWTDFDVTGCQNVGILQNTATINGVLQDWGRKRNLGLVNNDTNFLINPTVSIASGFGVFAENTEPQIRNGVNTGGVVYASQISPIANLTGNPPGTIGGLQIYPQISGNQSVTLVNDMRIQGFLGTGSAVSTWNHIIIADVFESGTGSVTNQRGIWIDDLVAGSTNIAIRTGNGDTLLCQHASARFGVFTVSTPVVQYTTTGTTTGFTAGAGTAVLSDSTFTGNDGSRAYTIGDIVRALKSYGFLAKS
jgi:hypothetical protein